MKTKKKNYILLFGLVSLFLIILIICNKHKEINNTHTIVWKYEDDGQYGEEFERHFNALLKKKGLDIMIDFQGVDLYSYYETGLLPDIFDADIVTITFETVSSNLYADYARNEKLYPLDDFLVSQEGENLYMSYPEEVWDSMRVDGRIFGILSPLMTVNNYIVFNNNLIDKHNIDMEQITYNNYLELVEYVYEKEKNGGNESIIALEEMWLYQIPGVYRLSGNDGIGIVQENGELTAKLLIDIPEYMQQLKRLNQLYLSGALGFDYYEREKGNSFALHFYSYSEAAVLGKLSNYTWADAVSVVEAEGLGVGIRGIGGKTVIMQKSDKVKDALTVLSHVYTDQELSEALAYGKRGENFEIHDGFIYANWNFSERYGNPFVIRPNCNEPINKSEVMWSLFEECENDELCGFYLDTRDFKEKWNTIINIQMEHYDFYTGKVYDLETETEILRKQLQEADVEHILVDINNQLSEFKKDYLE